MTVINPRRLVWLFILIFSMNTLGACKSISVKRHKDFRLFLDNSAGSSYHKLFGQLVADFNASIGFQGLKLVQERSEANSLIVLTPGLKLRDEKLGWGQWMTEEVVQYQGPVVLHMGSQNKDVFYSMRVEFDQNYIGEKMYSIDPSDQQKIRTLWCHEIGHGLQMNHVSEQTDVMYEYVDGDQKDFAKYFTEAKNFFLR